MERVGFIGLGSQGGPIAQRITSSGFPLTVWARRPSSLDPFRDSPAEIVVTPAEVGAASDVVGICVVADQDVEDVLLGSQGVLAGMAAGGIVVIHSTIHPDTCSRLATRATESGIHMVDAPVSGGGVAAAERRLLVMAGGDQIDIDRVRPIFETFADPVLHLGPLGSGQIAKLLNNLVFTAQVALALETYSFCDELGMDRTALAEVLASGSGGSRAAAILAASEFDTSGMRHAVPLLRKDIGIMVEIAQTKDVSMPKATGALAESALTTLTDPEVDGQADAP